MHGMGRKEWIRYKKYKMSSNADGFPESCQVDRLIELLRNVQTEAKEKYVALVAQLKEKHGVKE